MAMAQIKFSVNKSAAVFLIALGGLYWGILVGLGIVPANFLPVWIMPVLCVLIATQLFFGMYTIVTDTYIHLFQFPFVNIKIPYGQITKVSLQGMPFFANSIRTLFIVTKVKSISHIFFFDPQGVFRIGSDAAYGNKNIATIIKTIEQHAPHAQIDPMAHAFVNLVDSQKYKDSIPYKVLKAEEERIARL